MSIQIRNNNKLYEYVQTEKKSTNKSGYFKKTLSDVSDVFEKSQADNLIKEVQKYEVNNEYADLHMASRVNKIHTRNDDSGDVNINDKASLVEVKSSNYRITPRADEPYIDIYDNNGNKLGVFATADINIKIDSYTGTEILLSSHGTAAYDAIPMTAELKDDLCRALGTEYLDTEELKGYSIKTHSETGIQFVLREGDEGRGGRVLIRNEVDQKKFDALAEKYMNKYPNLISDANAAAIYADLEIRGLAKSTDSGIVSMGWNGASYKDNSDVKKNWAVQFTEDVFDRIDKWINEHKKFMEKIDQISAWNDMFRNLEVDYKRIWSDEELAQGYLNQQ